MKFTEEQLRRYAEPLGEAEQQKCKDAIVLVRDTLKAIGYTDDGRSISPLCEDTLAYGVEMRYDGSPKKLRIFVHGSCANDTNVCGQSDIDIAVVEEGALPAYGSGTGVYKDRVEECLKERFRRDAERENTYIIFHGDMDQKNIDTVSCRKYFGGSEDSCGGEGRGSGIAVWGDNGERRVCFPEQHIANGMVKDAETNYNYKKMVRIIKKMRRLMEECDFASAKGVSSYELESLLWNLPDRLFTKYCFYRYLFDDIVEYIYRNDNLISDYKEVNGIKPLCPRREDRSKISSFVYDLRDFYEYGLTEC